MIDVKADFDFLRHRLAYDNVDVSGCNNSNPIIGFVNIIQINLGVSGIFGIKQQFQLRTFFGVGGQFDSFVAFNIPAGMRGFLQYDPHLFAERNKNPAGIAVKIDDLLFFFGQGAKQLAGDFGVIVNSLAADETVAV